MKSINLLDFHQVKSFVSSSGLKFKTGPFNVCVRSNIPSVTEHLFKMYCFNPLLNDKDHIDFHITLNRSSGIRYLIKPQVIFSLDGYRPFTPLPLNQAAAQFEWGLNWCIASQMHQYYIVHSAVLEKDGIAIILPGAPGSGKSTLCAGLTHSGWRLLSDEMALVSVQDLIVQAVPRPVSLKNQSIDIIQSFAPDAIIGEKIKGTSKGDVSHMLALQESVNRQHEPATLKYLIFPKFIKDSEPFYEPVNKASACMSLIQNTFNFNILGEKGFDIATQIIDQVKVFEIAYPNLTHAIGIINQIICDED